MYAAKDLYCVILFVSALYGCCLSTMTSIYFLVVIQHRCRSTLLGAANSLDRKSMFVYERWVSELMLRSGRTTTTCGFFSTIGPLRYKFVRMHGLFCAWYLRTTIRSLYACVLNLAHQRRVPLLTPAKFGQYMDCRLWRCLFV